MKKKLLLVIIAICSLTLLASCEMVEKLETKAILYLADGVIKDKTGYSIPSDGNAYWVAKNGAFYSSPTSIIWNLDKKNCEYSITVVETGVKSTGDFRVKLKVDISKLIEADFDDVGGIVLHDFVFANKKTVTFMTSDITEDNNLIKLNCDYGYLLIQPAN